MEYNPGMRAALLLALVLAAPAVAAGEGPGGVGMPGGERAGTRAEGLTLEQAVEQAEKRYKARAVKAEERSQGDRRVYRIRLLSEDGRVFEITVDAATGRME